MLKALILWLLPFSFFLLPSSFFLLLYHKKPSFFKKLGFDKNEII
ncbi:MAG: hypothetical protein ACRCT1_23150 [Microcoleaceae cyanobacterium]